MKVLITGATGFIGRHLAEHCVNSGDDVHCISRRQPSADVRKDLHWIAISEDSWRVQLDVPQAPFDAIIHAATFYDRDGRDAWKAFNTNLRLPLELLLSTQGSGIRTFVNCDTFYNQPFSRHSRLANYTQSKRHFQEWGQIFSDTHPISFMNIRLFHVIGPGDSTTKFVPWLVHRCMQAGDVALTDGTQTRDFVDVRDVARALRLAANIGKEGPTQSYAHYDVGTGIATTIKSIAEQANRLCGERATLHFGQVARWPDEPEQTVANDAPIRSHGWSPQYSLHDSLVAIRDHAVCNSPAQR